MEAVFYILLAVGIHLLGWACALHALLYKTRHTTSAIAWILICILLPLLGAVLYLTVGQERLIRRRTDAAREARLFFRDRGRGDHALPPDWGEEESLVRRIGLATLTANPLVGGNEFEIHIGGDEAYPAMLQAISAARRSISWCFYIFDNDAEGTSFQQALIERARAGVQVRVLYDAVGSHATPESFWAELERGGVQVHCFLPKKIPWRLNLRNHRKLLAIDGATAFTGSMNVGGRHMSSASNEYRSRDIMIAVRGPVVDFLQQAFVHDWYFASGEDIWEQPIFGEGVTAGDVVVQAVESGPDKDFGEFLEVIVSAIHHARQSVTLVTPYFVPDGTLLGALMIAARRGVDVRLVHPKRTDSILINNASRNYVHSMMQMGVRVFERPGAMLHMKLAVIDSELVIMGSSNLDNRSLFLNFELDLVVPDRLFAERIEQVIAAEAAASLEVVRSDPGLGLEIVRNAAALFAPIL